MCPKLLFLARYLKKSPINLTRLQIIESDTQSVIRVLKPTDDSSSLRDFTPLAFLAELSCHIPNTWEQTVRYLGKYSARSRGANKENKISISDYPSPLPEPIHKPSANWARLIKKVFEFDPLLCSKCGSTMKIKAFITDYNEISRITKNLGIQKQRAPPKLKYSTLLAA